MKDLILVCEDLFGMEILSFISYVNFCLEKRGKPVAYRVLGFVSDDPDPFRGLVSSLPRLGTIESHAAIPGAEYLLGVKLPADKETSVARVRHRNGRFATVVSAEYCIRDLEIGEGSILDCYPKPGARFGAFVTVMRSMIPQIEIGDYTTTMRFANVTGNVGARVYIGNHAYVHHGTTVGDDAILEDGAIAVKNVKPGMRMAGVPAKRVREQKEMGAVSFPEGSNL